MLPDRITGGLLFALGFSFLITRASRRKALRRRPSIRPDVITMFTLLALLMGIVMLTGVEVLDFSTFNPAP